MKNKIHYTVEALRDLDEIWDYYSAEQYDLDAASKIVNSIMDDADNLKEYAELGVSVYAVTGVASDYRFLVSGKYLIFYHIEQELVSVDRVIHSRRDYIHILFGDLL